MNLVKVFSSNTNDLKQRLIKVLRMGKRDVQTSIQATPYGVDSNPVKDMVAVYSKTETDGSTVIVGYLNKNSIAAVGEFRVFSTDANGVEKFYTWLKNDGTIEIGGNQNFAVKFNELKTEFNKLKQSHNDLLTEYKMHVHTGGTISGSTGTTTSTLLANTSNISNAKNDKIKTIG